MDETTDVSRQEQASITVSHVAAGTIREDFVGVFYAEQLSGAALAELLSSAGARLGLKMENCRGLGFDSAENIIRKLNGCAALIQRDHPLAKAVHCFNHRLNLVVTKACSVPSIHVVCDIISQV